MTAWKRAMGGDGDLLALAAVLAAVVFVLPLLLPIPLMDPDEGLSASIAQEMAERGDWLTPRLLERPFFDKPILYFWAEALSLRLFGNNEAAVRLPGLLFGVLGAVCTAAVGWRLLGRTTGLIAGMFYATMVLPAAMTQAPVHDVLMVPCVCLALLGLWEGGRRRRDGAFAIDVGVAVALPLQGRQYNGRPNISGERWVVVAWTLLAGVALGLSILTKGLMGVALVGVAYGGYLLIARQMEGKRGQSPFVRSTLRAVPANGDCPLFPAAAVRGVAALAVAVAVAAPWYVAMELANPGYLQYFFLDRHLLGLVTASQPHSREPWWYYVPVLLGGGLPWIGNLPVTVVDGLRGRPGSKPGAMPLLWCWLIGCTLLLTLAGSKLATYLWPVFPAAAILAAVGWARLIDGTLSDRARRLFARTFVPSSLAAPAVLALALLMVQRECGMRFTWPVWTAAMLAALGAWVPLWFWFAGRRQAMLAASLLSAAGQFAAIVVFALPQVAEVVSARELARHFNRTGHVPSRVLVAEQRIGSLIFYLDADLRAELRDGQLRHAKLAKMSRLDDEGMLVVPEEKVRYARRFVDLSGVEYETAGRYRLYRAADVGPRFLSADARQPASQESNFRESPPRRQTVAIR